MGWNPDLARIAKDFSFDAGAVTVLLVILLGLQLFSHHKGWGRIARTLRLLIPFALLLYLGLLSSLLGSRWLITGLREKSQRLTQSTNSSNCLQKFTTLVVLGGGVWSRDLPTETSHARILAANNLVKRIWQDHNDERLIIFTEGYSDRAKRAGAHVFADSFRQIFGNNPSPRIMLEEQAQNTVENAKFTSTIMATEGRPKQIILLTSDFHLPRAATIFTRQGFEVCPYPVHSPEIDPFGWMNFANASRSSKIINEHVGAWLIGLQE